MPQSISALPVVRLDYSSRGPGLHHGLAQLEALLNAAGGREGHLALNVVVGDEVIPIVMTRADLYVLGFRCEGNWFRFDDAGWPFSESATKLGYDGRYDALGGLTGSLTPGSISGLARLADSKQRARWKDELRTLLVVVSECARLIPVRMQVLGLLNDIVQTVPLTPLAHYIQNWQKASLGTDMSRELSPTHRVGFRDPTIIKR
jgi:hypothetical protein